MFCLPRVKDDPYLILEISPQLHISLCGQKRLELGSGLLRLNGEAAELNLPCFTLFLFPFQDPEQSSGSDTSIWVFCPPLRAFFHSGISFLFLFVAKTAGSF